MKTRNIFNSATHWLIFTLANLLILFACSKDSGGDTPEPQPKPNTEQPKPEPEVPNALYKDWPVQPVINKDEKHYIVALFDDSDEKKIYISAKFKWADLNNNGIQEPEDALTNIFLAQMGDLKSPIVTLYEPEEGLALAFNDLFPSAKLKAIDVSHFPTLKVLNVPQQLLTTLNCSKNPELNEVNLSVNQFTAAAMLAMANSLPDRDGKPAGIITLQNKQRKDKNEINQAVLDILASKNWTAKYINELGKIKEYNGNPNPPAFPTGGYGVYIAGKEITSSNYNNFVDYFVVNDGKITYDPFDNVLTLNGVVINCPKGKIAITQDKNKTTPLTIVLRASNVINTENTETVVNCKVGLRITGEGKLTINGTLGGGASSISSNGNLTIDGDCTLIASPFIKANGQLTIDGANVEVTAENGFNFLSPITAKKGITLLNAEIESPKRAAIVKEGEDYVFKVNNRMCTEVKIVKK
ncbi:hypothetical protein [Capnocytophaga genosp. AHN8471]|uniref:hypothetical protein n=1 Tax=Capnocytophaga genosp. AHN8471 TaxID=327574 RepID=UPI0019342E44|nr:hypothetical protein [Capnocytophaga genosp. AHN8471]MBM0659180.1 hypothetical protein [Capnocytophaga genosp. AHN8471]